MMIETQYSTIGPSIVKFEVSTYSQFTVSLFGTNSRMIHIRTEGLQNVRLEYFMILQPMALRSQLKPHPEPEMMVLEISITSPRMPQYTGILSELTLSALSAIFLQYLYLSGSHKYSTIVLSSTS